MNTDCDKLRTHTVNPKATLKERGPANELGKVMKLIYKALKPKQSRRQQNRAPKGKPKISRKKNCTPTISIVTQVKSGDFKIGQTSMTTLHAPPERHTLNTTHNRKL